MKEKVVEPRYLVELSESQIYRLGCLEAFKQPTIILLSVVGLAVLLIAVSMPIESGEDWWQKAVYLFGVFALMMVLSWQIVPRVEKSAKAFLAKVKAENKERVK